MPCLRYPYAQHLTLSPLLMNFLNLFCILLLPLALAVVLLCVRLFFGKDFVHTHVDGNKALHRKGIHCAKAQDRQMRTVSRHAVKERG